MEEIPQAVVDSFIPTIALVVCGSLISLALCLEPQLVFGEVLTEEATTCPTAKYATDRRCSQHNHDALTYFRQRTNTQLNLVIADILLSLKCLIARRPTERTLTRQELV